LKRIALIDVALLDAATPRYLEWMRSHFQRFAEK
jgi:hypothetical protein